MNNRYAIIEYDNDTADWSIGEELDSITLGKLWTMETADEVVERFGIILEGFGYAPIETPSIYEEWAKIASDYMKPNYATKNEKRAMMAIVKLLGVIALAQVDQARTAMMHNEIMTKFL